VSVLTEETPFEVFKHFGFQSGKDTDKFSDFTDIARSENGITYLTKNTNAYLSLEVKTSVDFLSHTLFVVNIVDGEVLSEAESVTYSYYKKHIKSKPQAADGTGYRCNICGFIHKGDNLPEDFICPLCKHGASDFSKL